MIELAHIARQTLAICNEVDTLNKSVVEMTEPGTALVRLRQHVEAVWGVRLPALAPGDHDTLPGGASLPPGDAETGWLLYWAETDEGAVRLWQRDTPAERRPALLARAAAAWAHAGDAADSAMDVGIRREVALALPADARLDVAAHKLARRLTAADTTLLEHFEPGESAYYLEPARAPIIGVVTDGRLVSVAHSSRRTTQACELGIETLPDARRRGYALVATVLWAAAVRAEGLVPLYSALAANAASLALARAAGYRPFARALYLTR